jgi:hypothetical protein
MKDSKMWRPLRVPFLKGERERGLDENSKMWYPYEFPSLKKNNKK